MLELLLMPKLKVPLPWIAAVTSKSTQVSSLTDPAESRVDPAIAGALFQVRFDSVQGVLPFSWLFDTL